MIKPSKLDTRSAQSDCMYVAYDAQVEVREAPSDAKGIAGVISGYAVVYETESRLFPGEGGKPAWREVIARGAMREALAGRHDVRMLYQHDRSLVMARESAGTLRLFEDDHGVRFEADLIDTQLNIDAVKSIRARNLDMMSFGMPKASVVSRMETRASGPVRVVTRAAISEVSVVTWAAYEATSLSAREAQELAALSAPKGVDVGIARARIELLEMRSAVSDDYRLTSSYAKHRTRYGILAPRNARLHLL